MKKTIIVTLFNLILSSQVLATQETIIVVSQPIFSKNGIVESVCTYSMNLNYSLVNKMKLTCAENCIISKGIHKNRNLANIFRFTVEFSRKWEDMYIHFGDTVKVDLVVPYKFDNTNKILFETTVEQIVKSIIISLFNNATSYDFINYLDLSIKGNSEFEKYSMIYNKNNIFSYKDF